MCTKSEHLFVGAIIGLICLLFSINADEREVSEPVVEFVILSQPNNYNAKLAESTRQRILLQYKQIGLPKPVVLLTHEEWKDVVGSWTIFPILERLVSVLSSEKSWFFICEDITDVNVEKLLHLLEKYDPLKEHFLGYALRDQEATIIHHFALSDEPSFSYPDFSVGFLWSAPLLKRISAQWLKEKEETFSIDPKHEIAKFIWNNGKGPQLIHLPNFCSTEKIDSCVTWISQSFPSCGLPVPDNEIFFAVKTWEEFHTTRVPVVKATWGKEAKDIVFYSNSNDASIPTVSVGIPNVPHGHCAKTMGILKVFLTKYGKKDQMWLVIVDDDTLLSVVRLRRLLSCYNFSEAIILGERYGYSVATGYGYDYITGGGGMVFSMAAVSLINDFCKCPADDAPDDMVIGLCAKRLGISLVHSSHFHQARPQDYSPEYLSHQKPVSFHKHWMVDPLEIYEKWLKDEVSSEYHDEL